MPVFNIKAYYQNLARTFRQGPSVPHQIATKTQGPGEFVGSPVGTAAAYLRSSTNTFANHMSHYGNYTRLSRYGDYCLSGDTKVVTHMEGLIPIKEVVKRFEAGEKLLIYAYDHDFKDMVVAPIEKAWKTKRDKIWEATFDDGYVLRCTGNHLILLRNATFKEVQELKPDDSVMPLLDFETYFLTHKVVSIVNTGIEEDVYDLTIPKYHNFAVGETIDGKIQAVIVHNCQMETMAEVASALDIYSHEVCAKGEYGEILKVESNNPAIKTALTKLFYDTLNIEFNLAPWVRSLCKYGDYMLLLDHHPDFGIVNVFPMPVNEVEREEGFDPERPMRYRYRWLSHGNRVMDPWQVVHFRLLGNDAYLPYGMSILEAGRRAWRQLILMEDAVMVYRIVRSPERRVFYIDVGNVAPENVGAVMEKTRNNMKRNQVIDSSTGQVDLRYNALSVDEDYFIGVRGQDSGTKIDTLPGGQFVGDIEDLQYIQNKLFAALKIPKSYLGYEGDISGKSTLAQEDVRFARTIQHIQRVVIAELEKVAMIHLYSMGLRDEDLTDFELSMANPSTINEIQRLELWRTRFEVASLATGQEGVLDKGFIYRNIFKLSDQDIEEIEQGRYRDKLVQNQLDELVPDVPADLANKPDTNMGSGHPENVPANANADSKPEEAVGESNDPNQQRAIPNDMLGKAKKKKKRADSLVNRVYNTKKNGMDPLKDLQLMRRAGTAPWAEAKDDAIFEKRIGLLGRYSQLIQSLENLKIGQKKKNIL
jgi:hypothetical protein